MALTSVSAEEQIEEDKIERISVTGSRLKGIDIEYSSPVTVITREDIDASGATRLADVLRSSTVNTYGSRKESPGGTKQGQATLNLRGLGQQRTLVLINGHRIANSAAIPDAQNINLIPLAAIESVEILKDGASSVYGADAVGGVVNIILRKNINMHNLRVSLTQPGIKGGDEKYASFYGGITNNFGNITYSAEHQKKSAVFARDYPLTKVGLSRYGDLGSYRVNAQDPNTNQRLSLIKPDPRCPETLGQADYPDSSIEGDYCKFNYASHAQLMPESTRNSVMIDGLWQIKSDTSFFAHLDLSINESTGISAPTPSVGGSVYLPTMSASNPNNPTIGENIGFDSDFDGVNDVFIDGPFDLDVFYRNVNGGLRQSKNKDEMLNFYMGMSGDFANETAYEFHTFFNSNRSESISKGLLRRDLLQTAIDDGSFDIFSVNSPIDKALARGFAVDSAFDATFENLGSQVTFHSTTFGDDKSEHDTVYGLEYITHDYSSVFKDEFTENQIDGRSGGGSAKGKRDIFSAFAETQYSLNKKLNLNFSVRFDHYSDFGSSLNPKLGLTYRYSPNIIFRSSIGTGFRAPSLFEMYSQPNQGFDYIRDSKPCKAVGDSNNDGTLDYQQDVTSLADSHPCQPLRIEVVKIGNKDLEAEKSGSFTTGFTYEKTNDSRLHFNLYYQYFDNEINFLSNDDVLEREGQFGENKRVIRDEHGSLIRILNTYGNFSGSKTAGIDIEYDLIWQTKSYGLFKWSTQVTSVLFHKVEVIPGQGFIDINGDLGNTESRLNTSLSWHLGDWNTLISADFLPNTEENGIRLKSALVTNLQTKYQFNKHMTTSFGVYNLFESELPSSQALGWPYYTADELVQGRTLYLDVSYTF
jgi:iron complex outermembrane receptor protein